MPTNPPMSSEGFFALVGEVDKEMVDSTTDEILERLGLPVRTTTSYLARVTARLLPDVPDEETMRAIGDVAIIFAIIGHKAGEWQAKANAAD